MMKAILALLILVTLGNLQADEKVYSYEGKARMAGSYVDSIHNEARLVLFGLEGGGAYKLTPALGAQAAAGLNFIGGSSEAVFNQEFNKNSNFYLKEGLLCLDPWEALLKIRLGLINQGEHDMKLLIGGGAFPALTENSSIPLGNNLKLNINLQQSIPNTQTHSNRLDEVKEGTPFLHLEEVGLHFDNSSLYFHGEVTHFEFSNLSREVADKSRYFGNTVIGPGDLSQFAYDFAGFHFTFDIGAKFTFYEIFLLNRYLFNDKAPDGQNEGLQIQLKNIFKLKDWTLKVVTEYFLNEENASIGFYNDTIRGHSRRKGFALATHFEFPSYKLEAKLEYIHAKQLNSYIYTSDLDVAQFELSRKF